MTDNVASVARADVKIAAPRALYFAIFAISGFSGLIYESIWSHYLKLFLGHAAYAQSLVLIIFMGGMAAGSWIASRLSRQSRFPILFYALIEAIVGVAALLFHSVFTGVMDFFYTGVLPGIGSPAIGTTLKWLASSLLIMPQSILLGMTFPLMSAGIIRRFPGTPGGSIAMLYFTNSIGASIGVLASGFWLLGAVGLPGTIMAAGILNIVLAIVVWVLVRLDPEPETEPLDVTQGTQTRHALQTLFLVAAFVTGAASFIYEISWIRMLSLVLGATTHSFELMLSAFIAGLAFGGLWIRRRIDTIGDPVRFSGYVQLIMGVFAILTIPVYGWSFDWMAWLLSALGSTDAAFTGFSVASHLIALGVMLPATFMAGMTLPLFTSVLISKGAGEASIGRIYAANTVGAIIGVLFAVHVGLPMLGLRNLIVFGAALDIALAIVLLRWAATAAAPALGYRFSLPAGALIGAGAIVLGLTSFDIDTRLLVSGVYRYGDVTVADDDEMLFYKDGKTASVSLRRAPDGRLYLATNGKVDASIQTNPEAPVTQDEITMTLLGALPLAYRPDAERVANIGMGSGQTTHVVLGSPRVTRVDTIEIEAEMARASRAFGPLVSRAHEDPRSRIHIEDAKTFFSLNNGVYDAIIAEPSNPWVSGVSSLFSTEFYGTVSSFLEDDGVFVQWIQLYEFTDALAESILKALAENFGDFAIYATDSVDVVLIAKKQGKLDAPAWDFLRQGELGKALQRVGIHSTADLQIRKVAERATLASYLDLVGTPTNSDYYPYVDLNAGRARYIGATATTFDAWMRAPLPVLEMLHDEPIDFGQVTPSTFLHRNEDISAADWIYAKMRGNTLADPEKSGKMSTDRLRYFTDWLILSGDGCTQDANPGRWRDTVFEVSLATLAFLEADRAEELVERMHAAECASTRQGDARSWHSLYSAIAARDGIAISASARQLLGRDADLDAPRRNYLVAAAMLGHIAAGQPLEAHAAWVSFGAEQFRGQTLPEHLKLLVSIAVGAAARAEMAAAL